MALQKSYDDRETGASFPVAYHRVLDARIPSVRAREATIEVEVLVDATAASQNKKHVATLTFKLTGVDFDQWFGNAIKSRVYAYLKSLTQYQGAIDV